jgi:tripeptide aminopeptidase
MSMEIDRERLLETFLALVRIESPSGFEDEIAVHLVDRLADLGVEACRDGTGNVIGRWKGEGIPFLLTAHMDTVTPCREVEPVVEGGVIRPKGDTILGADDKSGIAQILEMVAAVQEEGSAHRPVEIAFTVGEEVGLRGAKGLDVDSLEAEWAVVLDHNKVGEIVVRAPSHDCIRAVVRGKAAHAGARPEDGVSAIRVAAEAIASMKLGRIDEETTANIGIIHGGTATNIIPSEVELEGEARSRDEAKLETQVEGMTRALEDAIARHGAEMDLEVTRSYTAYQRRPEDGVVRMLSGAIRSLCLEPTLVGSGGGTDGNILNSRGIPAVVSGTGMEDAHSLNEHIAVEDLVLGARLLVALATAGG